MKLDLASVESIREFVKNFIGRFDRLDLLINNAGVGCMLLSIVKQLLVQNVQLKVNDDFIYKVHYFHVRIFYMYVYFNVC